MPLKLDIGAGDYPYSARGGGDGWTTVDRFHSGADVRADLAALPYPDGAVDEVYSSHTLEHADDLAHARAALREWHRVLKVGGTLTIVVPNLDWCARRWLENPNDPEALMFLFGLRTVEGQTHRAGWNPDTLRRDLHDAGFLIRDLRLIDSHSQESILAVCERPTAPPGPEQLAESVYRHATDTVLVACPTYDGKRYALPAYIEAYNAFMYPKRGLFLVDNTPTGPAYAEHLRTLGVPCTRVAAGADFQDTLIRSWREIAVHAREGGWQWVFSLEQDVIAPPVAIDALLNVAAYCKAVHVAHSYPWHKSQAEQGRLIGLGCNLIRTELLTAIFAREQWLTNAIESEIFEYPKVQGHPTVELHNLFDVRHLDDEGGTAEYFAYARRGPLPRLGTPAAEAFPPRYNGTAEAVTRG